jgi:hypothetical protein
MKKWRGPFIIVVPRRNSIVALIWINNLPEDFGID